MKSLIVGVGVQGKKRAQCLKKNSYLKFDRMIKYSDYQNFSQIPFNKISHAYLCLPEKEKFKYLLKLLKREINVMVEKPLILNKNQEKLILKILNKKKSTLYTAYNHRFEPHLVETKKNP